MDQVYCFHGPEQRAKFGVDVDADGLETCRRCRRPVLESVLATSRGPAPDLFLATVAEIAGCRVGQHRGLVTATVAGRSDGVGEPPLRLALDEIRRQAADLGANAVVGLQMQSGLGPAPDAVTVMLMGTAVVVTAAAPVDADPLIAGPSST